MNYLFALLFISTSIYGQQNSITVVDNELTSKHVNVKGTKISLVPPMGWVNASTFNGFQQLGSNSSLLVIEIPGPYSKIAQGLTEEGLKTQGVLMENKKPITINGYSGVFIRSKQSAYGSMFTKFILVFGSDDSTFVINGMFPHEFNEKMSGDIEKSILSVVYESDLATDPVNSVNFEIDVSDTKFKFSNMMSNTLLYTTNGEDSSETTDKSMIMVGNSLGNIDIEDKKLYAINRIKKYPTIENINTENIKSITIDDISGYEIIAEGKDIKTGEPELIYQIMLFSDGGYYLIVGIANENFEENINLFKQISKTFKRK